MIHIKKHCFHRNYLIAGSDNSDIYQNNDKG